MPFIEVEKGRLYYSAAGSGRPLVLLHSAWATNEWWQWQIPFLSHHYRTYALDIRGHGKSSPLEKVYSVEGFSRDLESFLKQLRLEAPVLVGWSLGGIIAMQYCLDHPSDLMGLVLIATQGHKNPRLKPRFILYFLQAQLNLLMDFTQPRKFDRVTQQFPSQGNWMLEKQVRQMLSPQVSRESLDWIIADISNNPRTAYWQVIRSVWNWEAGETLKQIKVPTLILVGERDRLTPPHISERLHRAIPNSKLVIVKGASHYMVIERPEWVNTKILNFLKDINY